MERVAASVELEYLTGEPPVFATVTVIALGPVVTVHGYAVGGILGPQRLNLIHDLINFLPAGNMGGKMSRLRHQRANAYATLPFRQRLRIWPWISSNYWSKTSKAEGIHHESEGSQGFRLTIRRVSEARFQPQDQHRGQICPRPVHQMPRPVL